jgi:glycosyltransferase involved in cell wall biosynthesis
MNDPSADAAVPLRPDLATAVAAARRVEFAVRRELPPAPPGPRRRGDVPTGRLRLCYLVPRTDVGGGARVLFEHANRLAERGHEVTVVSHFPAPSWLDLRAPFRHVPFGVELVEGVPDCDVIVAGYWDQVLAARALGVAPVVHLEQGDFHLFEDVDPMLQSAASRNLTAADGTVIVSGTVAEVLRDRYGVEATVVHNAIDPTVFAPAGGEPAGAEPAGAEPAGAVTVAASRPYVLVVGWDGNAFKGMAEMRTMWHMLAVDGRPLDLVWVTPRAPLEPLGRVVVAPDQSTLAALYRGASVFVCCSHYETFALPCLEAMACGTPVVSTRNPGILEYARDGENALLADVRDAPGLAVGVRRVLDEPGLAERLRDGGLATAAAHSWDAIVGQLEDVYRGAVAGWSPPAVPSDWRFDVREMRFTDPDAEQRLRRRAAATGAAMIAVPVAFPAFEGHRVVRWQVVARRRHGGRGTSRAYLPAQADAPPADLPYAAALREFASHRFEAALSGFLDFYRRANDGARPGAGRWVALTLLELGRDGDAAEIVAAGIEQFPDHSDYHYLHAVIGLLTGRRVDAAAYIAALELLGPATHYDEWFDEAAGLVRNRLLATAR